MDKASKTYRVEGMHCAGCVASVEESLKNIDGVISAVVNLPLENVYIEKKSEVSFEKLPITEPIDAFGINSFTGMPHLEGSFDLLSN